jgi:hypothetical protein
MPSDRVRHYELSTRFQPPRLGGSAVGLPLSRGCFCQKKYFLQNEPKIVQCLPGILKKREANQSHFKAKKSQFEPN